MVQSTKIIDQNKEQQMQSAGIAEQSGVIKKNVLRNGCNQLAHLNATLNNAQKNYKMIIITLTNLD